MSALMSLALVVASVVVVSAMEADRAALAADIYWRGTFSNNYQDGQNWHGGTVPGGGIHVPEASDVAVIGTDSPLGALNSNLAPFGSPVLTSLAPPIDGVNLGIREFDVLQGAYANPEPAAGTLVGKLTIGTGGGLLVSPNTLGFGGTVYVGAQGRGFLTMTDGSLTTYGLVVTGENITTDAGTPQELGPSTVDLSGISSLQILGGANGIANLDRRIKVTGPFVNFNSTGRIRFSDTSRFTAAITNATSHSPLKTANNAVLNGELAIEFSGAGAMRDPIASLGQTWTLVRSTLSNSAILGSFTNLGPGGVVEVSGLDAAHAAPLGASYRVKKVAIGATSELQLSYEQTLVLTVDRDSGEIAIRNPLAGQIAIDGYSVGSARGSLLSDYAGLGSTTPNAGVWVHGTATPNSIAEVRTGPFVPDAYNLFLVPEVSLGTGFDRTAVGAGGANLGLDGEDLIFEFTGPQTGGILRGQVEYIGTKFENDLVLRVNPDTGEAFLKNDTLVPRAIDAYSILSSTGSLDDAGFTGLGGSWESQVPTSAYAVSQTNPSGSTTLAAGEELALGDVSAIGFTTNESKSGLSLEFRLVTGAVGDYNSDGIVNAADYTVWRDNFGGSAAALANRDPANAGSTDVTQSDYDSWKAHFGDVGGAEASFRVGSVVFDPSAGAGAGGAASLAAPEPTTYVPLVLGLIAVMLRLRIQPAR